MSNLAELSLPKLWPIAAKLGLSKKGKKDELLERIQQHIAQEKLPAEPDSRVSEGVIELTLEQFCLLAKAMISPTGSAETYGCSAHRQSPTTVRLSLPHPTLREEQTHYLVTLPESIQVEAEAMYL